MGHYTYANLTEDLAPVAGDAGERLFPRDTHVWEMFITPEELADALEKYGMQMKGLSGGVIAKNPLATLAEVRRHKRGQISVAELGRSLKLKHGPDLSLNYLGYAQK